MTTISYPHAQWQPLPWSASPHWAHWAAMDRTGNWFWYEAEPKAEDGYFTAENGRVSQFTHLPCPDYWQLSLQQRPTEGPFFFSSAGNSHVHLQP